MSQTVLQLCHRDFPVLHVEDTIESALAKFRREGLPHKVIYLYVVDDYKRLLGIVPTRLLLTTELQRRIGEIMLRKVHALDQHTTVEQARLDFARLKFLAFPVIDEQHRIVGVVDIEKFAVDLGEVHERTGFDDIYELLGLEAIVSKTPWQLLLMRAPWLGATLVAGIGAAMITGAFELTLQRTMVLAFFLALVLGFNEAVAMQSATLSVQWFHRYAPEWKNYLLALGKEIKTASGLAGACGAVIAVVAFAWKGNAAAAGAIGISLFFSVIMSCIWGLTAPFMIRRLQADPRLAAAPIALALTDVSTLVIYFGVARLLI